MSSVKLRFLTEKEAEQEKKKIDQLSHYAMAKLWRYAPAGHPYFDTKLPLYEYFKKRFDSFGGMTSKISKEVGWQ